MEIELHDIRKYFGSVKANDGISMKLRSGHIYGLLGENGAGKSTLMKILSGYQPADSGELLLDETPSYFNSPAKALKFGIGMLYQEPLDLPPFKIIDNYLLGKDNHLRLDYKTVESELLEYSYRYNFKMDVNAYIDSLSLGERQQLELIRLLAGGAQVLILDEPTTGISAEQKELLFDSMRKLAHEEGKTIILVSHKLDEVQELCDHAFILRKGKLVGEIDIPCSNESLVRMMFGQIPERSDRSPEIKNKTMLEIRDLAISTYRMQIEGINLEIKSGEVFGLAGLEGSGQELLMQTIAGLIQPVKGKIYLDGKNVTTWSYHRMQDALAAYVPAGRLEAGLVSGLSITEHVVLAEQKHAFFVDWKKARQESETRIEEYQIVGNPGTLADELSGGNQQRLLFALLNTPLKLVMLEHPTRGLDVQSTNYIWEKLYSRRDAGTAILFMSADLDEIIERSDRIAVFSGGNMSRIVDAKSTDVDELGHLIGGQE
ncbi:MAG: ABC transporter ATP-binding protein [Anaerolineales bacterium]|jgi:ABC-type uncharacterized transport system ATPase subunit